MNDKTLQDIINLISTDITVLLYDESIDVWDGDKLVHKCHGGDKLPWDGTIYVVEWVQYDRKKKTIALGFDLNR